MPVVSFLRYVPVTAFSPLLILWFGDWGADENFVPIYCDVCLLAAVDPALL